MWNAVLIDSLSNEVGLQEDYLDIKVTPAALPDLPDSKRLLAFIVLVAMYR